LRFPELRLQLPSIELPRLMRFQHSRQMQLDRGTAPFVAGAHQEAARLPMQMPMHAPMAAMQMQVASAPLSTSSFTVARTESAPERPESAADPEAAPEATDADVADLCKKVEAIQKQLQLRQQELQQQMQQLNSCMIRLNQGAGAPANRPRIRYTPGRCDCPKCRAARVPRPIAPNCDAPTPHNQFQSAPGDVEALPPVQPEPIPMAKRTPAPLPPTPLARVTPADATKPSGTPRRLSDLPSDLSDNDTKSAMAGGAPAVLRLPKPE
jgi:hypothetical protein